MFAREVTMSARQSFAKVISDTWKSTCVSSNPVTGYLEEYLCLFESDDLKAVVSQHI
jgi:hypothetical protein